MHKCLKAWEKRGIFSYIGYCYYIYLENYKYCYNNKLTSLEFAPSSVGGNFGCSNNFLTSLVGAPDSVGEGFYCGVNLITSLEGAPRIVPGYFDCNRNKLTSLKGSPQSTGDYWCSDNLVKFTEKQVRAVCKVKGDIFL